MDSLLICIEEIALEGLDGCTTEQLWRNLERRLPPLPLKLDTASKEFLWKGIVRCTELEFFFVEEPLTPEPLKEEDKEITEVSEFDVETYPFKIVNDADRGIRGSSIHYESRENVTSKVRGEGGQCLCTLMEANERWSGHLSIVASQELRNTALLGPDGDHNIPILDLQFCILQHIAQSRYKGRMQNYISRYFLHMDPKTTYHHLNALERKGLITRQCILIKKCGGKTLSSNVVLLKRFHKQRYHKHDIMGEKICMILNGAPEKEMTMIDMLIQLDSQGDKMNRKHLLKVRDHLVETGYIECFIKHRDKDVSSLSHSTKPKKRQSAADGEGVHVEAGLAALRLLKPFVLAKSNIAQLGNDINGDDDDDDENDDDEGDDNDDDEDEGEKIAYGERDGNKNRDHSTAFVAEKTWLQQTYDAIESRGPHGLALTGVVRACHLPKLDVRMMVNVLTRQGYIKSVMQATGKVKTSFHVAVPHYESSGQLRMIQEEQLKLKEMRENLGDVKTQPQPTRITSEEVPSGSPDSLPCPSPAGSVETVDVVEAGSKHRAKRSKLSSQVTHRTLRRKTFIVELLKSSKVIQGEFTIQKAIQENEKSLGIGKVDRRTVSVILQSLLADGLIKKVKTVICHAGISVPVELLVHSSLDADDPAVLTKIDQIRFKLFDREKQLKERLTRKEEKNIEPKTDFPKNSATKSKTAKKEKRSAVLDLFPDTDTGTEAIDVSQEKPNKTSSGNSSPEKELVVDPEVLDKNVGAKKPLHFVQGLSQKYGYQSKYSKAQAIHELIWQLVYGIGWRKGATGTATATGELNEEISVSEAATTGASRLGPGIAFQDEDRDFDWLKSVAPLPLYDEDQGWFRLLDLLPIMPLSIFCQAIGITHEVEGLDEYYFDPSKKHTLIRNLPATLRTSLTRHGCSGCIKDVAVTLCGLGLLTPRHPIPAMKVNTMCYVSEGAIVVDTTSSVPGFRRITPPNDDPFPSRMYLFSDFEKVKSYWYDLKCVCLNTPLGILRNKQADNMQGKRRKLQDFIAPVVTRANIGLPPGDALGAGGLDSNMSGHMRRNWSTVNRTWKAAAVSNETPPAEQAISQVTKIVTEQKTMKKGGKGEKRNVNRLKRKPAETGGESVPKPKKPKKIPSVQRPVSREQPYGSTYVAVDEIDQEALKKRKRMRMNFTPEEDSLILLCRVAQGVMKRNDRYFYPYKGWRRVLHETFECSEDKTAPSIHRRVFRLLKNPTNKHNYKICLAECQDDQEFKGFDNPDLPFDDTLIEVVKRLKKKFRSTYLTSAGDLNLVGSLKELHDNYTVQPLCPEQPFVTSTDQLSSSPNTSVVTANDVHLRNIRNQIQSAFLTPQDKHDAYRIYNMFGIYADNDLESVFVEMLAEGLLTRKRCPSTKDQFTRSLPFAAMTYRLSFGYHKLFDPSCPPNMVAECRKFIKQLERGEPFNRINEAGTEMTRKEKAESIPGELLFKEDTSLGAHVGCILSLLASDQLTVEISMADELIELDMEQHEHDDSGEKDERSDDSDDEKKDRVKKPQSKNSNRGNSTEIQATTNGTTQKKRSLPKNQGKKRKNLEAAEDGILSKQKEGNQVKKRKTTEGSKASSSTKKKKVTSESDGGGTEDTGSDLSEIHDSVVQSTKRKKGSLEDADKNSVDSLPNRTESEISDDIPSSKGLVDVEVKVLYVVSNPYSSSHSNAVDKMQCQKEKQSDCVDDSSKDDVPYFAQETQANHGSQLQEKHQASTAITSKVAPETTDSSTTKPIQSGVDREECISEVFTLQTPAPVVCKFTSPHNLSKSQTVCPYLYREMEPWQNAGIVKKKTASIPVSQSTTPNLSRASRTSLCIARGNRIKSRSAQGLFTRAFNTHDVVEVNNCQLKVKLKHKVGPVLGPVEGETLNQEPSTEENRDSSIGTMSEGPGRAPVSDERCRRMFRDTERVIPGLACITVPASHEIISLEEYTAIALTEFGFTDADTLLLKFIHDAVYKEGEIGLPLVTLQELFHEKRHLFKEAKYSLDYHVNRLCAVKMIFKVGLYQTRLVCATFAKLWCAKLLQVKDKVTADPHQSAADSNVRTDGTLAKRHGGGVVLSTDRSGTPKALGARRPTPEETATSSTNAVAVAANSSAHSSSVEECTFEKRTSRVSPHSLEGKNNQGEFTDSNPATCSTSSKEEAMEVEVVSTTIEAAASSADDTGLSTAGENTAMTVDGEMTDALPSSPCTVLTGSAADLSLPQTGDVAADSVAVPITTGLCDSSADPSLAYTNEGAANSVVEPVPTGLCDSVSSVDGTVTRKPSAEEVSGPRATVEGLTTGRIPAAASVNIPLEEASGSKSESKKAQRDEERYDPLLVISRPWVSFDGTVNKDTFKMMEEAVALLVMHKPGIREDELLRHFTSAVSPVAVREILEVLQIKGCITKHSYTVDSTPSLFSSVPKSRDVVWYYVPTIECIVRLAAEDI